MAHAVDVAGVVGRAHEEVEVVRVAVGGVERPVPAHQVVVRVEAAGLVAHGEAALRDVPRGGRGHPMERRIAEAADLEAVAVAALLELRSVPVVHRPAALEAHALPGGDAVVAVVAVEPGAAAAEDVVHRTLRGVAAEAVDVAAAAILRREVMVTVGVAVQDQVVGAAEQVDPDGLAVVQREPLQEVMTALDLEIARLAMALEVDLRADDLEPAEVQPGAGDLERVDAPPGRVHLRAVEDRFLRLVGPVTDRLARLAALPELVDVGPDPVLAGDPVGLQLVDPAADPDRVAGLRQRLRPHQASQGLGEGAGRLVGPVRGHEQLLRAQAGDADGEGEEQDAAPHPPIEPRTEGRASLPHGLTSGPASARSTSGRTRGRRPDR